MHRLTYWRHNHKNLHVRGYKEKGSINTPLELAIRNQIECTNYAYEYGVGLPEADGWTWPY